jgi:protein ImuA
MLVRTSFPSLSLISDRAAILARLRGLLARQADWREDVNATLPFGLASFDSHLPNGGLTCGALHEIVPTTPAALPAAFGFVAALLSRFFSPPPCGEGMERSGAVVNTLTHPHDPPLFPPPQSLHSGARKRGPGGGREKIVFVMPAHTLRRCGRLSGHGLKSLGLNPRRAILVETAHWQDSLWALVEALRSAAPQAVAGMIDRLDLKTSQKLHLAAIEAGLPLLLLRPSQTLESSAAATRWRIDAAAGARDRFGSFARARWQVQLERCRNGRPGEWVVEYNHVAHRFSLVAALADLSLSRRAGDQSRRQANRS